MECKCNKSGPENKKIAVPYCELEQIVAFRERAMPLCAGPKLLSHADLMSLWDVN